MAQGMQLCFAAFTAFLLIVIDQSAAKCVQNVSVPATLTTEAQLQTACTGTRGVYYANNGIGSCYTVIETNTIYTTAQKSCTQLSSYNGHLAYWRDGAALKLVNKNLITVHGQYFIGEVLVNNQWTNQDAKGINGALFNMTYMCSDAICYTDPGNCASSGTFGAFMTYNICMGKYSRQGISGNGMYYICEYENMASKN